MASYKMERTDSADKSEIQKEIEAMLKENTGAALLDSGGAYGRHWERNQKVRDFSEQPSLYVDYDSNGISCTLNVYHFLTSTLDVTKQSKRLDNALKRFANKPEYEYTSYDEILDDFYKQYLKKQGLKVTRGDNTYNGDSMLSQGFTYNYMYDREHGSEDYPEFIILQLHNGCDIRGGYTAPRIFEIADFDRFILSQNDLDATCECTNMYSDDEGWNWYVGREPEPTMFDTMLDITNRDSDFSQEENKFPKYWEIKPEEKRIFCKCCKTNVEVSAGL